MLDPLLEQLGEHAALIVVDLQNDFTDPRGALAVAGAEQLVPIINDLVTRAERANLPYSLPRTGTHRPQRTSPRMAGCGRALRT